MKEILVAQPIEMEQRKTFDFKENNVEVITLDELKRTYKENDILGRPLREMYHYEIIDAIQEELAKQNLTMEISEIFAAQNRSRQDPAVVINPEIENKYGKNAIEAHVLRRVFANIRVYDFDNDELTTNIGLAFHQNAIQIGYGPMVKVCHNQCIMSPERVLSTNRSMGVKDMLHKFGECMQQLQLHIEEDKEFINRMKEYQMLPSQILQLIGMFECNTISYYSKNTDIHNREFFPLNLNQIGRFTEDVMVEMHKNNNNMSLWDVYNVATNLYKADDMEIPSMFSQHLALNRHVKGLLTY